MLRWRHADDRASTGHRHRDDTFVYFTDGETPYAPEGIRHVAGVRPGSSFEELEAGYGTREFRFPAATDRWAAKIREGVLMVVDIPEPAGTAVLMEGGPVLRGE